jgi:hypothetical protein
MAKKIDPDRGQLGARQHLPRKRRAASDRDVALSEDLLIGAEAIAQFIFGDRRKRRQVYHLIQKGALPAFRLGATLCARRSTLVAWVAKQESQGEA